MSKIASTLALIVLLGATGAHAQEEESAEQRFARELIEALQSGDVQRIKPFFSAPAFTDRLVARGIRRQPAIESAMDTVVHGLVTNLVRLAGNARFKLLAIDPQEEGPVYRLRMVGDAGLTYLELLVTGQGRGLAVADFHNLAQGEWSTETMARNVKRALEESSPIGRFAAWVMDQPPSLTQLKELQELHAQQRWKDVLAAFDRVSPKLKRDPTAIALRLDAAQQSSSADLAGVLAEAKELIAAPAWHLRSFDAAFNDKRWDDLATHVDAVDQRVGRDPYLELMRVTVSREKGDFDRARKLARSAIEKDSDLTVDALDALLTVALAARDHPETARLMVVLEKEHGFKFQIEDVELYKNFIDTPEHERWMLGRGRVPLPKRISTQPLGEARRGFKTKVRNSSPFEKHPVPKPPPEIFQAAYYRSPAGKLAAYVTPNPRDGKKHPAVLWAHGGFGWIDAGFWEEAPDPANDQTARAFREAGLVLMIPSWRAENLNPGRFELFFGEVDDLLAARDYLAGLPYVDPRRIYLAGHSSGGTLVMLAAASSDRFRAAFSFGGAPDLGRVVSDGGYGNTPYDPLQAEESRLRSAIHFAGAIRRPTFYFEGEDSVYCSEAERMMKRAREAGAPFTAFTVRGANHFDILAPLTALVARKILADTGETAISISEAEVREAFAARER